MERKISNSSDIFSKYLSPLEDKGEPTKENVKKQTLPPALPSKQLSKIDEQPIIELKTLENPMEETVTSKIETDNIYDDPDDFNPRKFNANYNGTIQDPHYKIVFPGNGEGNKGSPTFTRPQYPPPASGPNSKHDLGFTEINNQSASKNLSARISSIRDIVEIRKRINEQVTNKKDGTFNRYIYLDRGNTWCLRIFLFVCIITIIILLIIVSQNSSRLTALEEKKAENKASIKPITDRNSEENITQTSARPRKDEGHWSTWSNWHGCECRRKDSRFRICRNERRDWVKNCLPTRSRVESILNLSNRIRNTGDVEFEEKICPSSAYRPIVTSSCANTVQNPSNFGSGSTIIKSPKYPQPYPNNIECFWNISVPCQGTVPTSNLPGIKITFDKFLLKSNEDILEIKMGSWLLHSIRGKEQPQPMFFREQYVEMFFKSKTEDVHFITTSTNRRTIHFPQTGFQAQVDLEPVNWNPPS